MEVWERYHLKEEDVNRRKIITDVPSVALKESLGLLSSRLDKSEIKGVGHIVRLEMVYKEEQLSDLPCVPNTVHCIVHFTRRYREDTVLPPSCYSLSDSYVEGSYELQKWVMDSSNIQFPSLFGDWKVRSLKPEDDISGLQVEGMAFPDSKFLLSLSGSYRCIVVELHGNIVSLVVLRYNPVSRGCRVVIGCHLCYILLSEDSNTLDVFNLIFRVARERGSEVLMGYMYGHLKDNVILQRYRNGECGYLYMSENIHGNLKNSMVLL